MAEGSLSESGNWQILPSPETSSTAAEENRQQRMLCLHSDCIQPINTLHSTFQLPRQLNLQTVTPLYRLLTSYCKMEWRLVVRKTTAVTRRIVSFSDDLLYHCY